MTERRYPDDWSELDTRAIDTVRVLAAAGVQNCRADHPGSALALARLAYTLYPHVLVHDPNDVNWAWRARFVLSVGHSSLTQYVQWYLGGFGLDMKGLEALRAWDSLTPGQ